LVRLIRSGFMSPKPDPPARISQAASDSAIGSVMNTRKIRFSVSPNFVDKTPLTESAYQTGFQAIDGTVEDIASIVADDGWAFSYVFYNNKRQKTNFMSTDILAVDIDKGMRLDDALEHPIVKSYASLLYTTPSHTIDDNRFRLVFLLPRTISKSKELVAASKSLTRRLGGDMAATDAARIFFGNKGCQPMFLGNEITTEFLDELINDGSVTPLSMTRAQYSTTSSQNGHRFKVSQSLVKPDGSVIEASQVNHTTSIQCPYHHDTHPSALVSRNSRGDVYIHCSSCQMTWWMEGSNKPTFDFYSFENTLDEIRNKKAEIKIQTPFGDWIDSVGIEVENVTTDNAEHIEIREIKDGLTFIKSPKGSGKTTFLSKHLPKIRSRFATLEEYEEETDFEFELPFRSDEKILLIGHRRALIGELANRLGLNCYLDDDQYSNDENNRRRTNYAICLDSLPKIKNLKYDIIVLDEVEQVLAHFMSETVGDKRTDIFNLFSRMIHSAQKVVALDADLSWTSFLTLTTLTQPQIVTEGQKSVEQRKKKPVHIYINDRKVEDKPLLMYSSVNQLVEKIMSSAVEGKRVFVASNSKEKVKLLTHGLTKGFETIGVPIPMIAITSDNSGEKDVQDFIKNIKTKILDYKVVLTSPSLGTGIDITFEGGRSEIDCVFGIFENRINSHFEIDQQLARVRHPKEVHVWVSPQEFHFETDFNIVKSDYMVDRLIDITDDGYTKNSPDLLSRDIPPFIQMASMIVSTQRASKNHLRKNFIDYKVRQGWTVIQVEKNDDLISIGKEIEKFGDLKKREEYVQNLMNARPLNQLEFKEITQKLEWDETPISEDELYSMIRTRIELFYRQPLTEELITMDDMY